MARRSPDLVNAVKQATAQMHWLAESDQAVVALALAYAEAIETDAKALGLGRDLLTTLKALGGTPADRQALGVEEVVRGRLAHLRAVRRGDPTAVDPTAS